jgi:hypothetical protein
MVAITAVASSVRVRRFVSVVTTVLASKTLSFHLTGVMSGTEPKACSVVSEVRKVPQDGAN